MCEVTFCYMTPTALTGTSPKCANTAFGYTLYLFFVGFGGGRGY